MRVKRQVRLAKESITQQSVLVASMNRAKRRELAGNEAYAGIRISIACKTGPVSSLS